MTATQVHKINTGRDKFLMEKRPFTANLPVNVNMLILLHVLTFDSKSGSFKC